jgi:hypothetical protein
MSLRHLMPALVAAVLMPACIDDFEQGAVTVSDEGVIRVLHHPCDERNVVLSVRLLVPVGNVVADGDDIVLWTVVAVRTSTPSLVETFEPGNIPGGYRETVPLDMPEKGDEVVIYLDIRGGGSGAFGFDWGSLSPGTLLTQAPSPGPSGWTTPSRVVVEPERCVDEWRFVTEATRCA